LLLLIMTVCFGVSVLPALWLDLFPSWVGALVLIGYFVLVFLMSLLASKWLSRGRRAEYGARLMQRQGIIFWACTAATVVGIPLSNSGHRVVEVVGLVITFAGLCVAWWAILRALPPQAGGNIPDGGDYQI
ncbi:MAG TPA: hypothetical protein VMF69_28285, partial [Gemmataceae bacterium]|nr:hypothetical protein [Gemmataceae bacterium]